MNSSADEEMLENDVHYGIADCRRRLRSQRSTLRPLHHPPKGELYERRPPECVAARLEEREEAVIT
jgi:hypothetical protein